MSRLDVAMASRMARIALGHVTLEYPHKLDHVMMSDADARTPRALHPVFFGSFDWHSCVHGWWTLLTVRRLFPDMPEAAAIDALADSSFTAAKVADAFGTPLTLATSATVPANRFQGSHRLATK